MLRPLKLAHTSDVHLHNDAGPERAAFARVVDAVIESQADLFLIAGDLFDHNRIQGDVVEFVYGQLARVDCPTVIIAGNHDCFDERSILRDMDFGVSGNHVHLLREVEGRSIEFPELHATVWGRSMEEHAETNKPLAGAPQRRGDMWHIGMAHGLYVDYPDSGRSSLITPDEIAATGFDYLALGHVHVHGQMLHGNTLACYPGAPVPYGVGRHPSCVTMIDLIPGQAAVATQVELPTAQEAVSA